MFEQKAIHQVPNCKIFSKVKLISIKLIIIDQKALRQVPNLKILNNFSVP